MNPKIQDKISECKEHIKELRKEQEYNYRGERADRIKVKEVERDIWKEAQEILNERSKSNIEFLKDYITCLKTEIPKETIIKMIERNIKEQGDKNGKI